MPNLYLLNWREKEKHTWRKQNFGPVESVVVVGIFYNTPPARQIVMMVLKHWDFDW